MRRALAIGLLCLTIVACGDGGADTVLEPTTAAAAPSQAGTVTAAPATTTTTAVPTEPSVLALASGRGDDGSFEVIARLASDPFVATDHRIVVGADVDDAHPGVGDPLPFLNGHLEITPGGARLMDGDTQMAAGDALADLVSWAWSDGVLRVFFFDTIPARGGTTWVIVQVDGESVVGGTAGAPFGTRCSFHSSGLDLPAVPGVEDTGTPCRYPLG